MPNCEICNKFFKQPMSLNMHVIKDPWCSAKIAERKMAEGLVNVPSEAEESAECSGSDVEFENDHGDVEPYDGNQNGSGLDLDQQSNGNDADLNNGEGNETPLSPLWFEDQFYVMPQQMKRFEDQLGLRPSDEVTSFMKEIGDVANTSSPFYALLILEQYKEYYGLPALICQNWDAFNKAVKDNDVKRKCALTVDELDVYMVGHNMALSSKDGEDVISLVNRIMKRWHEAQPERSSLSVPHADIHISYDQIGRKVKKYAGEENFVWSKEVAFPSDWNMDTWDTEALGPAPEIHKQIGLDAIECILKKLVNPELMLGSYSSKILFQHKPANIGNERVVDHFMSGE